MQSDSRKSFKPKSASWVAAMVAMVSDLAGRSGHDQGGREVVKWWSMREPKRGDADMDSQARVVAVRRFDTARLVARHGRRGWLAMVDEDGESCDCAKAARIVLVTGSRSCTYFGTMQAACLISDAAMAKIWPGALSPVIGAGCWWIR